MFRSTLTTFIQNLALVLLGLGIGFALAEGSLRLYGHLIDFDHLIASRELFNSNRLPSEIFSHATSGERQVPLRPNSKGMGLSSDFSVLYEINQFGMRDRPYDLSKDENSLRILALGDSYTFGEGVADRLRFTEVSEDHFENAEILNFGVPGYGLDQTLALFHYHGARLKPDVVILFMAATLPLRVHLPDLVINGVVRLPPAEESIRQTRRNRRGTVFIARNSDTFRRNDNVFIRNSHVLSLLYQRVQLWMLLEKMEDTDNIAWQGMTNSSSDAMDVAEFSAPREVIERSRSILRELRRKCAEMGARFVVVNIDSNVTFSFIPDEVGAENYFDYSDELTELSKVQPLRFKYDQHFNPETHGNIAKWLIADLKTIEVGP